MSRERLTRALAALAAIMTIGASVMASDQTDEDVLALMWRSPDDSPALFSEIFLKEVPPDQIRSILADLNRRCGAFVAVEGAESAGEFRLITERCEVPTEITRNVDGAIEGLWFYSPVRRDRSLDELLDEIASFDGTVSYALLENGKLIAGHEADRPMGIGSTFKLIVLAALVDRIEKGEANWADVVTLEAKHLSHPSGSLQEMPIGSPFTLHTLAAAMIAQSDNTATDVLIDVVGRDRLEAMSGLQPFLTTREAFQLEDDEAVYERFRAGDRSERYAVLRDLADAPLPPVNAVMKPWKPEVEWLLSTKALCGWVERVADVNLTQINTGPIRADGWQQVSYKGGSQVGVLNFTTHARDAKGRNFCLSVTWNADKAIDDAPLGSLYASVFHALRTPP
ncbi:MAG: serine hydrolase [Geminicoccaceae bacterium]